MKKLIPIILTALIVTSCAKSENTPVDLKVVDTTVSSDTEGTVLAETDVTTTAETVVTNTSTDDTVIKKVKEDTLSKDKSVAIDKIFGTNLNKNNELVIAELKDGSFKILTDKESENVQYYSYYKSITTREMYNAYLEIEQEDCTYEEYLAYVNSELPFKVEDISYCKNYKFIYILTGYNSEIAYGENDNTNYSEVAKRILKLVINKIDNGAVPSLNNKAQNDDFRTISVEYMISDNSIYVIAMYLSVDGDTVRIIDEYIGMNGEKVVTIGGATASADTESLFISTYDKHDSAIFDSEKAEEYDTVVYDYGSGNENRTLDMAQIVVNFPKLKKIYISSYINISDLSAFSKLTNLSELSINVSKIENLSSLVGIKADKLILSGVNKETAVLSKLNVKELCISYSSGLSDNEPDVNSQLAEIFKLKNVTELSIDSYSNKKVNLSGISAMTGLKKFYISTKSNEALDLSPMGQLNGIQDLSILAINTKNLNTIAKLKSVKKLMLHSMDKENLSFLSNMTWLEELTLMYVNNSFQNSLSKLQNINYLSITDITNSLDYSNIYKMKNLKQLHIMGGNVKVNGISSLSKLETLNLMLCSYSDLSPVSKCSSLKNLSIYNCITPTFNAKDISGMTGLEFLHFNSSEIYNYKELKTLTGLKEMNLYFCNLNASETNNLKKSLPKCKLRLDDDTVS